LAFRAKLSKPAVANDLYSDKQKGNKLYGSFDCFVECLLALVGRLLGDEFTPRVFEYAAWIPRFVNNPSKGHVLQANMPFQDINFKPDWIK